MTAPVAAGTAAPPITLSVIVNPNAPASVTNSVTVSGGGETNTANDTASDVTAVFAEIPTLSPLMLMLLAAMLALIALRATK